MGGYEQSKYVAERLVQQSFEKGIVSGSIFRLGMVGWNSNTGTKQEQLIQITTHFAGVGNERDWIFILFYGINSLKQFPDSEVALELLPVNFVAEAIHKLGLMESTYSQTIGIFTQFKARAVFYPIDICGNELVPFQKMAQHTKSTKVSFGEWTKNVQSHGDAGLLMFSGGLPDDRKYKQEIAERGNKLLELLQKPKPTWDAGFDKYVQFIQSHK